MQLIKAWFLENESKITMWDSLQYGNYSVIACCMFAIGILPLLGTHCTNFSLDGRRLPKSCKCSSVNQEVIGRRRKPDFDVSTHAESMNVYCTFLYHVSSLCAFVLMFSSRIF